MTAAMKSWKSEHEDGSFAIPLLSYSNIAVMVANTPQTFTVPTGAKKVTFAVTGGADFWAASGSTVSIGATTAGAGSILNPTTRILSSTDTQITLQALANCSINMCYFL